MRDGRRVIRHVADDVYRETDHTFYTAVVGDATMTEPASTLGWRGTARPTYRAELAALQHVYAAAIDPSSSGRLIEAVGAIGSRPTIYVASGGAIPVARFAADIHLARTGTFALATTPLGVLGLDYPRDAAAVIVSSRAGHPDVALGLAAAGQALTDPILLVTNRDPDELPQLSRLASAVVHLPLAGPREGFLATRSVLALAAAFAATLDGPLPVSLPAFEMRIEVPQINKRVLVLHGARGSVPASDLETRISELGIAAVAVADYRNFAHGRHVGFARHLAETLIVSFIDADDRAIAEPTLALLPPATHLVRLESPLRWPASSLDLLVGSMKLVGELGAREPTDPSRPKVDEFGRRLYRLPARRRLLNRDPGAVERKLASIGRTASSALAVTYRAALDQWLANLANVSIGGVVVDYDGTVCATPERFALPRTDVQTALIDLLRRGLMLGVASGRGNSLVRDLRAWLPEDLWPFVEVGLYNGGMVGTLDREFVAPATPDPRVAALDTRIANHPIATAIPRQVRATQITLRSSPYDADVLDRVVRDLVSQAPVLDVRIARSGHSLDLIAIGSKRDVVERLLTRTPRAILAIGDQGQPGGNDHELLAATPWSLSVDRCSADPSRCWNLLPLGVSGPDGILRYLAAITMRDGAASFRWRRAR